jgi:diguanylate cyclase (GGDEF)-like protein
VLLATAAGVAAPLVYEGVTGALLGQTALRIVLLSAVGLLASMLMRSVRAQRVGLRDRSDQAERLARLDELTGLPNRRAFGEALDMEISRAQRFGSPLALLSADLDGFKQVNDTFGHPAGDACLRHVADILKLTLRQYDACFRVGGDEFTLLLPETSAAEAETVARRVTAAVAAVAGPDGASLRVTCAPAELAEGMTGDALVAAADAELLARKRSPGLRLAHSV